MKPHGNVEYTETATIITVAPAFTPDEMTATPPASPTTIANDTTIVPTKMETIRQKFAAAKTTITNHQHTYTALAFTELDKFTPKQKLAIDQERSAKRLAPYDFGRRDKVILSRTCGCGASRPFAYGDRDEMRQVYQAMQVTA